MIGRQGGGSCLPDLTRQEVSADFINSIDSVGKSPIPIIYQSGYLTIKNYDERFGIYTLGFPNEEVEEGVQKIFLAGKEKRKIGEKANVNH